jgi:hypothetical protein
MRTEIKEFIFRIFFFTLLMAATLAINAQDQYQATIDLNLRSGPGSKYNSIEVVKSGEKVTVLKKTGSLWYKVVHNGEVGYLSSKFLTAMPPEITEQPEIKPQAPAPDSSGIIALIFFISLIVICIFLLLARRNAAGKAAPKPSPILYNKSPAMIPNPTPPKKDDSVVEITGNAYNLKIDQPVLSKYGPGVPFWSHHYVYAASEINSAGTNQIRFYQQFKYLFKKGICLDLEGNTNYAFILLFDMINEYEEHKNLLLTKQQLAEIGRLYPKTSAYGIPALIKKLEVSGDSATLEKLNADQPHSGVYNHFVPVDWGLGTRNKVRLHLTDEQEKILNEISDFGNRFTSIELCSVQIIRLFFSLLTALTNHCNTLQSTLEKECATVADIEVTKRYRFTRNSANYKYQVSHFTFTIYQILYTLCENSLRGHYFVGRKTDLSSIHSPEAMSEFNNHFGIVIEESLKNGLLSLITPDAKTEIALNMYCRTRWKNKLEILQTEFKENEGLNFYDRVLELANLNKENPSLENIFFEAFRFVAGHNPEIALKLYAHYIYFDLQSARFDNRKPPKNLQRLLFKNDMQSRDFDEIIGQLILDKDLTKALIKIPGIYQLKRRKIQLDSDKIAAVQLQDSGTVELLSEYLKDDTEPGLPVCKAIEVSSSINKEIGLNSMDIDTIHFFSKNGYSVPLSDLDAYAKSIGAFRNSLIARINEACFEVLDDVLIEEDAENFTMNENYYAKIMMHD